MAKSTERVGRKIHKSLWNVSKPHRWIDCSGTELKDGIMCWSHSTSSLWSILHPQAPTNIIFPFLSILGNIGIKIQRFCEDISPSLELWAFGVSGFFHIVYSFDQAPKSILFFDQTTFLFEVNPRRAWQRKDDRTEFFASTNYYRFHLLMVVSLERVVGLQIFQKRVDTLTISQFLLTVIEGYQQTCPRTQLSLVLNNKTLQKTVLIKQLCAILRTNFVFTAPNFPFLNLIELCFRYLQVSLRNTHDIQESVNKAQAGYWSS